MAELLKICSFIPHHFLVLRNALLNQIVERSVEIHQYCLKIKHEHSLYTITTQICYFTFLLCLTGEEESVLSLWKRDSIHKEYQMFITWKCLQLEAQCTSKILSPALSQPKVLIFRKLKYAVSISMFYSYSYF